MPTYAYYVSSVLGFHVFLDFQTIVVDTFKSCKTDNWGGDINHVSNHHLGCFGAIYPHLSDHRSGGWGWMVRDFA